jgi:hypothetical protein
MNRNYIWQPAYLTAVFETDDAMMMGRILEARAALEQRLLVPIDDDSVEYKELVAAQKALEVLKSERVDKIDLHANAFSGAIRPGCVSDSSGFTVRRFLFVLRDSSVDWHCHRLRNQHVGVGLPRITPRNRRVFHQGLAVPHGRRRSQWRSPGERYSPKFPAFP